MTNSREDDVKALQSYLEDRVVAVDIIGLTKHYESQIAELRDEVRDLKRELAARAFKEMLHSD